MFGKVDTTETYQYGRHFGVMHSGTKGGATITDGRIYTVGVEVGGAPGVPRGRGRALGGQARLPPSWIGCGPPGLDSFANIFY